MEEKSEEKELLNSKDLLKSTIYSAGSKYLKNPRNIISTPSIPKAANWGWSHLPWPAKLMIGGVLCGVISVTTPYWVYLRFDSYERSTFGLFHYCTGDTCTSIHDNLVESRSVDAWFHLVQGSMCIGVACSIVSLAVMTNNLEGTRLRMSPTTLVAAAAVLAISAFEQFVALLIFSTYVEDTDFLFDRDRIYSLDFYGSFYIGIFSTVCSLIGSLIILLNNSEYRKIVGKNKPHTDGDDDINDEKVVQLYNEYIMKQREMANHYNNNGYNSFGDGIGIGDLNGFLRCRSKNYGHDDEEELMKRRVFEEDLYGDDIYGGGGYDDDVVEEEEDDDDDDGDDLKKLIPDEDNHDDDDDDEVDDEKYINNGFDDSDR